MQREGGDGTFSFPPLLLSLSFLLLLVLFYIRTISFSAVHFTITTQHHHRPFSKHLIYH